MSKMKEQGAAPIQDSPENEILEEELAAGSGEAPEIPEIPASEAQEEPAGEALVQLNDRFLRLAAEYDNYRKRTAKEKESLWGEAKSDTVTAFLPVYDNLERALKQETADEAYKKGVEMIMAQLKDDFAKLGVTEIPALGEPFDPNLHNAVMHVDDGNFGENTIAEVFQAGFTLGEKVIRFSMVKVAN